MYIVVLVTCANLKEAQRISQALVRNKLAACVNIVVKVNSIFWWQAKLEKCRETLLIIKSKKAQFLKIVRLVRSLHSYAVPEIIALPIVAAEKRYLEWLSSSLK